MKKKYNNQLCVEQKNVRKIKYQVDVYNVLKWYKTDRINFTVHIFWCGFSLREKLHNVSLARNLA